ncbi:Uncharacterised protein [Mycobacterium tuberculosis]|nr:Uncharacterised protein [Mycobacterium tuberculosis]CKP53524.1 Uncharacterised protein [Mycobacterium tuberculosis]
MPSQLHRRHAHPAGAGMDQHALARPSSGQIHQRVVGGGEHHRGGGGGRVRPPRRHLDQQPLVGAGDGSGALGEQAHYPVSDRERSLVQAGFDNDAAGLNAHDRVRIGIQTQRDHDVAEVGGNRGHRNSNLPGAQRRVGIGNQLQPQILEGAGGAHRQPPRPVTRRNQQPAHRAATVHPRRINLPAPPQHLRLACRHYRRQGRIVERRIGIDQHDPARMLGLRRPHQSPYGAPRQIGDIFARQCHRTAGHHHQNPCPITG